MIVADEGLPLKRYLLRPYGGKYLPDEKRIFNYRLSRARRVSENAFGILIQRYTNTLTLRKKIIMNL